MTSISGATAVYAVLGHPIRHSFSPRLHNSWMAAEALDAVYVALPLDPQEAAADIRALHRAGLNGLNVTAPHKAAALAASAVVSPLAARVGAANTLVRGPEGWVAHNTDVLGFSTALTSQVGSDSLAGAPVLVLGAGGSARAVLIALQQHGAEITLANRTAARAQETLDAVGVSARVIPWDAVAAIAPEARVVINATSAGHGTGPAPILPAPRRPDALAIDLSYGPAAHPFLEPSGTAGWRVEDGLSMLVHQAARAFELWFGLLPDVAQTLAELRGLPGQGGAA
jgi:shikimate dehydrogenase